MAKIFKPSGAKKLWLKLADKNSYNIYKHQLSLYKITSQMETFVNAGLDTTIDDILDRAATDEFINIFHTGNAGDIIYALPVIKALFAAGGKRANLLLKLGEPLAVSPGDEHPLGGVMLNSTIVQMLKPLVEAQEYINEVRVFNEDNIHLDLTLFRTAGFPLDKGDIGHWNFFTSGINADLSSPWLHVKPNMSFSGHIVLARSSRYNNALIDFSFLSGYDNLVFVGVESEYESMKQFVPGLQFRRVSNFLTLAQIIAGCRLFIGNQSFPYSVAEGLKTPRLLETFYQIPNVMPSGPGGYDFYFQRHFEWLVTKYGR